jgi:ABC-type sugar transport system ATPase subunit
MSGRKFGEVILDLKNISLSFGGVKALQDISFNVLEHEIRAIIGPNGAGKSSMLNVINGVYRPQQGDIILRGEHHANMDSYGAATAGLARTFQNIALFKGMSVLDNIMTGRNLKMKANMLQQAIWFGPAMREELGASGQGRGDHRLPRNPAHPQDPGGAPALRPAKARGPGARPGHGAADPVARRADGRHERRGKAGHVPLHPRRQ